MLYCLAFVIMVLTTVSIAGQQVKFSPFSINESVLLREIKTARTANPKITPEQLAAKSNEMLQKMGLEYYLQIDPSICDKLNAERAKHPKRPVRLLANLQSVDGDRAKLAVPEPLFELGGCAGCFLRFALLEMTADTFVTKVQGYNIRFALPSGVRATRIQLVDPMNETNILAIWRIPVRWVPIGISYDENVIYLSFDDADLKDLALAVFTEGTFEFVTRTEAEASGKPVDLQRSDADKANGRARREFDHWKKKFVLSYPVDCSN